jgi:protein TonB
MLAQFDPIRVLIYDPPPPPPSPLPKGSPLASKPLSSKPEPSKTHPVAAPTEDTLEAPIPVADPLAARNPLEKGQPGSPTGSDVGVPEGIEGGIEGGVVGGVPAGVLGGVIGGTGTGPVPVPIRDYDRPPRLLRQTSPRYPEVAFIKKVQGVVVVELLIDDAGRVARARVIQSVPLLDAAAMATVRQWSFAPAVKHGRPVATLALAPVTFRIY